MQIVQQQPRTGACTDPPTGPWLACPGHPPRWAAQHRASHNATEPNSWKRASTWTCTHNHKLHRMRRKHLCVTEAGSCGHTVLLAGFPPAGPLPALGSCGAPLRASEPAGSRCLRRKCSGSPATAGMCSGQQDTMPAALLDGRITVSKIREEEHSQPCTAGRPARQGNVTLSAMCMEHLRAQRSALLLELLCSYTADSNALL